MPAKITMEEINSKVNFLNWHFRGEGSVEIYHIDLSRDRVFILYHPVGRCTYDTRVEGTMSMANDLLNDILRKTNLRDLWHKYKNEVLKPHQKKTCSEMYKEIKGIVDFLNDEFCRTNEAEIQHYKPESQKIQVRFQKYTFSGPIDMCIPYLYKLLREYNLAFAWDNVKLDYIK